MKRKRRLNGLCSGTADPSRDDCWHSDGLIGGTLARVKSLTPLLVLALVLFLGIPALAAEPPTLTVEWKSTAALEVAPESFRAEPDRRILAANATSVFVEVGALVELDLATGKRRRSLRVAHCADAPVADMVIGPTGGIVHYSGTTRKALGWSDDMAPGCNEEIVGVDLSTGRKRWSRTLASYFNRATTMVDGDMGFSVDEFQATAIHLADGRNQWRTSFAKGGAIVDGNGPTIDGQSGMAASPSALIVIEDSSASANGGYNLTSLRRSTGHRDWSARLEPTATCGTSMKKLAATSGVVALTWDCGGQCEKGRDCPKRAVQVAAFGQVDGKPLWQRAFPDTGFTHAVAKSGAMYIAMDDPAAHQKSDPPPKAGAVKPMLVVALAANTGVERWRVSLDDVTEILATEDTLILWTANHTGGRPTLLGLDSATGVVAWKWTAPPLGSDEGWAVPWYGLYAAGNRLVLANHATIYCLRLPGSTGPLRAPGRRD